MDTIVITDEDAWDRGMDEIEAACGLDETIYNNTTDAGPFYILEIGSINGEMVSRFLMDTSDEDGDLLLTFNYWEYARITIDEMPEEFKRGKSYVIYSQQSIIAEGHRALEKHYNC